MAINQEFDLVIEASRSNKNYWSDLWKYRELFLFLAWRDILVRYKQTVIGLAWSLIRPFLTMLIFTIVFGRLANLPSDGMPYAVMVYAGMLPWLFFSTSFNDSSNSLISNSNMLTKIYFPRMIVPASTVIVNFIDFLISFLLFIGLMLWYHFVPSWTILTLPLFFLWVVLISMGAGFYVAAVNVKYRDFKYIVPFVVQFGLYVSPVGFSSSVIPEKWRLLYSVNPIVGVIDGFRWAITGDAHFIYLPGLLLSITITLLFLLFGTLYFRKMERVFADLV